MKRSYTVPVRLSEDLLRKLIYISEAEGRSVNNHFNLLLRNNIQYFERSKGRIDPAALRSIDVTSYDTDTDGSSDDRWDHLTRSDILDDE